MGNLTTSYLGFKYYQYHCIKPEISTEGATNINSLAQLLREVIGFGSLGTINSNTDIDIICCRFLSQILI